MALEPAIQQFGINAAAFLAGIDEMLERTDQLAESIDAAVEAGARMGADLGASAGKAAESLDAITESADRVAESFDAATEAADGAADAIGASADRIAEQLDLAADGASTLAGRLTALVEAAEGATAAMDAAAGAADTLTASLDRASEAADVEAGSAKRAAGATEGMGTVMRTALLGVAIAAAVSIVQAAKFQSIMLTLSTQAGVSKSALAGLSQGVLDLAGKVGFSPSSLATALYHIESSFASVGIKGPQALKLLQIAAEGAAVGHANLTDVTNALDATIVSGVPGVTSYSQAMGALNAIVGSGDMTMQDLANAMGTGIMAVARSFGQNIYQVGAALALFGDNNIRGAKAATELRMAWQAIQAPLTTAKGALTSLGLTNSTLADTMEHHGMSAAIDQFITHLKNSHVPMSDWGKLETDIFGKKAGVGIGIMVDQYGRLMSKFPDLKKGAEGFGGAWAQTQKTFDQQWHDFMSGLDALAVSFGTKLLPPVTHVVGWLAKFMVFMEKHGEVAAFAGAVLVLATGFKLVAAAQKLIEEGNLLKSLGLFGNVWFLAAVAVVALGIALYELYKHSKLVRDIVADVGHALERAFKASVDAAKVAIKWLEHVFDDVAREAKKLPGQIAHVWDDITRDAAKAGHAVAHAFAVGWDAVYRDTIGEVVRTFSAVKGEITSGFDGWWKKHGKELEEVWRVVWTAVKDIFKTVWSGLTNDFNAAASVVTVIWDAIATAAEVAWDAIAGFVKDAWGIIAAAVKIGFDAIAAYVKTGWDIAVGIFRAALAYIELVVKTGWDVIAAVFKVAWAYITMVVKIAWDVIVGIFSIALDLITGHWSQAWTDLKAMLVQVWNAIKSYLGTTWDAISALAVQIWDNIRQFIASTWDAVKAVAVQVWNAIKGFFEQTWNAIAGLAKQVFNNLMTFLSQTWTSIQNGVTSAWGAVVTYFKGVPAKILAALGDVGHLLYTAGQSIVEGLISGIESKSGDVATAISQLASGNVVGAFMTAVKSHSPSKVFYQLGAWITEGLANGISETASKAEAKARQLAADVRAAYLKGQITSAEETQLLGNITGALASRGEKLVATMRKIGLAMSAGLLSALENAATRSAANSAVNKLISYVEQAWSVGDISFSKASSLTTWLEADNDKLENLAQQRQKLAATIKLADTYATTTTNNTESWAGLSNVTSSMTSGGMVYSGNILSGMKTDLSTISKFSSAIKRLGHLGLSKNLLNQLIQMGPDQGLQVATALLDGPLSVIKSMNQTQAAINSASTGLGQTAADLMYDSGKQAGKGFLSGLQAQQKNITKLMDQIAKSMVDTIEKDLKIHSPSLVTTEHGEMFALGLANGMQHGVPWVKNAAHALSAATSLTDGHGGGTGGSGSGQTNITVHVTVNGFVGDNQQLATEIYRVVQEEALVHDRRNGNNGLTLTF